MTSYHRSFVACVLIAAGCGGGDAPAPDNVNPYANNPQPQNSAPLPAPTPARSAGGRSTSATATPDEPPPVEVPEAGYAAEMSVPLSFFEYARFIRRSSEMLAEMSKIHVAVSETGEAADYQDRWGELTAEHSGLVRNVVESAYPPADLARELRKSALPRLNAELKYAAAIMENYDDLEGGLAQPYAEAKRIFDHLAKNLTPEELATMPEKTLTESDESETVEEK